MSAKVRSGGCALVLLAAAAAHAGCTRPIEAPMAPMGLSMTFDGERASGLYPTLLRELGASTGCQFQIHRVPRARQQKLFESGQSDLMAPAARTPSRDAQGEFVPLVQVRASLLTTTRGPSAPRSLAELLSRRGDKLAVVRGLSYGPAYDHAVAALRAQQRLIEESDPAGVARALRQGLAQSTVMTAHLFIGALGLEADIAPLARELHIVPLAELGWADSGVYLSLGSLAEADRRLLSTAFRQATRSGRVWQLFGEHYPAGSLAGSVRPLP